MIKKIFGILLVIVILGCLGFCVYLDISEHGATEAIHYVVHILVCITFCTLLHNPAHRFIEWMKCLLGFKHDDHDFH